MKSILDIKIFPRFGQGSHKCFCRLETFVDFKYIIQVFFNFCVCYFAVVLLYAYQYFRLPF